MRVLIVTEDLPTPQPGGLGRHAVTLGNRLLDLGHEVALMGRSERPYAPHAAEIGFQGCFIAGFDLSRSRWKEDRLGVWMPYKRPVMARWIADGIGHRAQAFDVVHYHGHLPMVGGLLPPSINFVQTRHDQGSECITNLRFVRGAPCESLRAVDCAACAQPQPGSLRRAVSTMAVKQYRHSIAATFAERKTIFVSDFLRRQFQRAQPGVDLRRAEVIHNFVDLRRLWVACAGAPPVTAGTVLVAGRLSPAKGQAAFLDAIAGRLPGHARVLLAGDGEDLAGLRHRHGGNDQIRFIGWQSYDDVLRLTCSSQICVVPSVWEEPCATTILEALALGRPCIALRRGGTPELARHERFDGQLQLADSMAGLVELALNALSQAARPLPPPQTFGADIDAVLPQILAAYARPA